MQTLAAKADFTQLQAPYLLPEIQNLYQHALGERLSSTARVLGRPSFREVLERPDGRCFRTPSHCEVLVVNKLSVTAHSLRPLSRPPLETDLTELRDELACTMTATWCGWSFARVTSAFLRGCRLASQPLYSMPQKALRSVFVIALSSES